MERSPIALAIQWLRRWLRDRRLRRAQARFVLIDGARAGLPDRRGFLAGQRERRAVSWRVVSGGRGR